MSATNITLLFTALSALGAFIAAVGALWAANSTKNAAEGAFLAGLIDEYDSLEMRDALRTLRNWEDSHGKASAPDWFKALKAGEPDAHRVGDACRKVKCYFYKSLQLFEGKYASKRFLRSVCCVAGINIFYDIVEPLEVALGRSEEDRRRFNRLHKLCPRYPMESMQPPIPVLTKTGEDVEARKT